MTGPVHPDWDKDGARWPNRDASQFVEAGGIRWHYQRMGAGPVLLLLHGAGAATHSWRALLPLLATNFDVIAPDLPGHGFTRTQSRRQCSLPAMAGAVTDLMTKLEMSPDVMLGHSAGTAIALDCVLSLRLSPRCIIGLNAALAPFRGLAGVLFPPLAKLLALNPLVPRVFSGLAGSGGTVRRLIDGTGSTIDSEGLALYASLVARAEHVEGALAMMALWDLDPLLAKLPDLQVPLHLVVGEGDKTVPPNEALALAGRNSFITAHEIPALGHLMHEEDPEQFAALIRDLVALSPDPDGQSLP